MKKLWRIYFLSLLVVGAIIVSIFINLPDTQINPLPGILFSCLMAGLIYGLIVGRLTNQAQQNLEKWHTLFLGVSCGFIVSLAVGAMIKLIISCAVRVPDGTAIGVLSGLLFCFGHFSTFFFIYLNELEKQQLKSRHAS